MQQSLPLGLPRLVTVVTDAGIVRSEMPHQVTDFDHQPAVPAARAALPASDIPVRSRGRLLLAQAEFRLKPSIKFHAPIIAQAQNWRTGSIPDCAPSQDRPAPQ